MRPPRKTLFIEGEQTRVELTGDLYACMEYEEVTDGQTLEELALSLEPEAESVKEGLTVRTKRMTSRHIADLLYAFSANWRDDSGWNSGHHREGDPVRHPRERSRYLDMVKMLSVADKRRCANILLSLLFETVFPPGETATAPEPAAR